MDVVVGNLVWPLRRLIVHLCLVSGRPMAFSRRHEARTIYVSPKSVSANQTISGRYTRPLTSSEGSPSAVRSAVCSSRIALSSRTQKSARSPPPASNCPRVPENPPVTAEAWVMQQDPDRACKLPF